MHQTRATSLALGVVIGVAVGAAGIGLGASHLVCVPGPVVGWSGPLGSPVAVALAPPGAYVTENYSIRTNLSSTSWTGELGATGLENWSTEDFEVLNWTYTSEVPQEEIGWGPSLACTGFLNVTGGPSSGCGGCIIANATPGGLGQRLSVPEPLSIGGLPLAGVNVTYPSAPVSNLTWHAGGGDVEWNNPQALLNLGVGIGPFYVNQILYGFGISVFQHQITFEVPIHFVNGTERQFPASFPSDWPVAPPGATTISIEYTYVLPLTSGQGTWAVYLAGGTDQISAGGLLFEQTSN